MMDCIFCHIIAEQAPASFVYQDELVAAFLDVRPVSDGHVLVIPKAHATYLADLPGETAGRIFPVALRLGAAVRKAMGCQGVSLYLADGEAAGQTVFHVHLHIIPRNRGDRLGSRLNAWPRKTRTGKALDEVAESIRGTLDSL